MFLQSPSQHSRHTLRPHTQCVSLAVRRTYALISPAKLRINSDTAKSFYPEVQFFTRFLINRPNNTKKGTQASIIDSRPPSDLCVFFLFA